MKRRLAIVAFGMMLAVAAHAESRPFVAGSMAAIREAHADRPYVMALWSMDCPPCHDELAMLGAWRRAHPAARLVLISTDTEQSPDALLRKYGLDTVESWVFADEFAERLRYEIDPAWRGELPRSYLIDGRDSLAVSGRLERARLDTWWRTRARP